MRALQYFVIAGLISINTYAAPTEGTTQGTFPEPQKATEGTYKPHIGLQLGYAEPGEDRDGAMNYGFEFGYQPYIPLATALEITHFDSDRDNQDNLQRTTVMAKSTYNFGGPDPIVRYSYVGAGIGAVMDTEGENETNLGIKLLLGADFPLASSGLIHSKSFTLGANVSYLSVVNAQDNFALNGQMKYWF